MFINILVFLAILILTYINGLTDATNAISTIVGTKVLNFRKACILSSFFDVLGILVMYYINNKVANCIGTMVEIPEGTLGLTILLISILSAVFFSAILSLYGIPTSESHGLIAAITGATLAVGGKVNKLSLKEVILRFNMVFYSNNNNCESNKKTF